MIVRKVRGQNKIHPIRLSQSELKLCKMLAINPETYVNEYVKDVAKKRKWKWFFEKKVSE